MRFEYLEHLVHDGWRHAKESLKIRFGGRSAMNLGVVMDEGENCPCLTVCDFGSSAMAIQFRKQIGSGRTRMTSVGCGVNRRGNVIELAVSETAGVCQ